MFTEKATYIFMKLELGYLLVNCASELSYLALLPLVSLFLDAGVTEILHKRLKKYQKELKNIS